MNSRCERVASFVGISVALLGARYAGGTGWESADDWAALVASLVIAYNGVGLLRPAVQDLMARLEQEQKLSHPRRVHLQAVTGGGETVTLELELWLFALKRTAA